MVCLLSRGAEADDAKDSGRSGSESLIYVGSSWSTRMRRSSREMNWKSSIELLSTPL